METSTIQEPSIILNERKIVDVRKNLKGKYNIEGIALDLTAKKEALVQYQSAINLLIAKQQKNPDQLSIFGLGGSFATDKPRLGIFDPTDFNRPYDKIDDFIHTHSLNRLNLPSDLDIIIKSSYDLDQLEQISKSIFYKTGIFTDLQYHHENVNKPLIDIQQLSENKIEQFITIK